MLALDRQVNLIMQGFASTAFFCVTAGMGTALRRKCKIACQVKSLRVERLSVKKTVKREDLK